MRSIFVRVEPTVRLVRAVEGAENTDNGVRLPREVEKAMSTPSLAVNLLANRIVAP